jgi:hypothetical protein
MRTHASVYVCVREREIHNVGYSMSSSLARFCRRRRRRRLLILCRYFMSTSMGHLDKSPSALLRDNVRQIKAHTQKLQSNAKEAVRRMPVVLTEQQLTRLKEHKYASAGTTLFDPFMQKFWIKLVEYCPLWVAPNLLTIVGLAMNIGTSVLLMIGTNGAKEEV